jgi:8-oxo-dGTP diphosphatase
MKRRKLASVSAMILRNGKILLGKRNSDPIKASSALHGEGTWTMPGGKLEFGESMEDCALREVMEETGIKLKKENLRMISISNDIVSDAHFVTIGFLAENFENEPEVKEPEKITEWKWFEIEKLPNPIFFPSERVVKNYLNNQLKL